MFKIAFRNVLRNGRRSLMTASAVAVGAAALILFGQYYGMVKAGMSTGVIQSMGHLSVFKQGYTAFGSGRPLDYSISNYDEVIRLIENDPVLKPMLNVVTPSVSVYGIAGSAALDKSKTFFGSGFIPSDRDKMHRWDEFNLYQGDGYGTTGMRDGDLDHGFVGKGMARMLGLCKALKLKNCPVETSSGDNFLTDHPAAAGEKAPRLDLLASAGGAPNIVAFYVNEAKGMGAKELDDNFVGMNLPLAQQLLFGAGERKVSSIVIQLKRTEDIEPVRARLGTLFKEHKLDMEVRDFQQLMPIIVQTLAFFQVLFGFLALILSIIVLFTVANTMSMSVMERTNEIGTARAMGVRRGAVRRQFLLEGAILGTIGATAGIALAALLAYWINHSGITYVPPGDSTEIPLSVLTSGTEGMQFTIWLALAVMASLATIIPANRAARMKVVDALRHI